TGNTSARLSGARGPGVAPLVSAADGAGVAELVLEDLGDVDADGGLDLLVGVDEAAGDVAGPGAALGVAAEDGEAVDLELADGAGDLAEDGEELLHEEDVAAAAAAGAVGAGEVGEDLRGGLALFDDEGGVGLGAGDGLLLLGLGGADDVGLELEAD